MKKLLLTFGILASFLISTSAFGTTTADMNYNYGVNGDISWTKQYMPYNGGSPYALVVKNNSKTVVYTVTYWYYTPDGRNHSTYNQKLNAGQSYYFYSNYNGFVAFQSAIAAPPFTPQLGDLNCDGKITAGDANLAMRFVAAKYKSVVTSQNALNIYLNTGDGSLTAKYADPVNFAKLGDIDGDGFLTMVDALNILRKAIKLGLLQNAKGKPVEMGDVNGDGSVGLLDGVLILKYVVAPDKAAFLTANKNYFANSEFTVVADMNGDQFITNADATNVLKRVVGLPRVQWYQ